MRRPSIRDLPPRLAAAAAGIAEVLRGSGQRAWIVGGAVRDLALARVPKDVDLATAAHPEELERLFERTLGVGRAFGTLIVRWGPPTAALDVEVTTFRSERGYSDRRRPDEVRFGATLEEDAARRDFTCNALYLDPLSDELADPTGGLGDLERGVLRCVGAAEERFREDGLRLLRLARFAGAYGLAVEDATLEAARRARDALQGVAAERVLGELLRIFSKPGHARAFEIARRTEILGLALPGQEDLVAHDVPRDEVAALRDAALARLPDAPGAEAALAILYDPLVPADEDPAATEWALECLDKLRPPKRLRSAVLELWQLQARLEDLLAEEAESGAPYSVARGTRVLLVREPSWPRLLAVARAWGEDGGFDPVHLEDLERFRAESDPAELFPKPLVSAHDLKQLGLRPGPIFGELLAEAELLQLDGLLASRAAALSWARARAQDLGEGDHGRMSRPRRK